MSIPKLITAQDEILKRNSPLTKTYTMLSKCRRCGETLKEGTSVGGVVMDCIASAIQRRPPKIAMGMTPDLISWHFCPDGGMGVTDLIGAKPD